MSAAVAAQIAAGAPVLSDSAFHWLEVVMLVGIALAVIATYFTARANKRLDERIRRRREQRCAEAQAASTNIDALAGRSVGPLPMSQESELED